MSTREEVIAVLHEVKPTKNLSDIHDVVEGGYIDSFELMLLISKLCDKFNIEIEVDDIVPENFNSVDCIIEMVKRLRKQ